MKIKKLVYFITLCVISHNILADSLTHQEAIIKRLQPVSSFNVKVEAGDESASVKKVTLVAFNPEAKYNSVCSACHTTGAAGAPKLGDKTAWALRLSESMETVYNKAINGYKGMPPKGTCMSCSDDQIKQIVDYVVSKVK